MKEPDVDDARAARGAVLAFWAALRAKDDLALMRVTTQQIHNRFGTHAGMAQRLVDQSGLSTKFVDNAFVLSTALVRHDRSDRPFLLFYCRDFAAADEFDETQIVTAFEGGAWKVDGPYLGENPPGVSRVIDVPDPIEIPPDRPPQRPS